MSKLEFENFSFVIDDEDKNIVIVTFAKNYFFKVELSQFKSIDNDVIINEKLLEFPNTSEKSAENKFNRIIEFGLNNLTNKITGKKTIYIDENSNIPLIGSSEFGIVDRNTNIIEIKPLTGCNMNCIYCSVNEGDNKKTIDILIDPYYLAIISEKIANEKTHPVEFNINPQGEPLLYPFLEKLIIELRKIKNCKVISMNTNGTLFTKQKIDILIKAGITRLNISLNTLDKETADKLSGKSYPLIHVLEMIKYAQEKNLAVLIAPVIVPTFNDDNKKDIEPLIKFATELKSDYPKIGFQKFLCNKGGRNPVDEITFEDFFKNLKQFEEKYNLVLTPKPNYNPFDIFEDKTLEKPFKRDQKVKVEVLFGGRKLSETICKAKDRIITLRGLNPNNNKKVLNVKIVREKANIFIAVPLGF
jgi:uncharacterized protein